jgi:hypothetical protein
MATIFRSNGNYYPPAHGPDPLAYLLARFACDTLDPVFEGYGNFIFGGEGIPEGHTRFWGGFHTFSHVFSVDTDDADLIALLTKTIRDNQASPAYAQAKVEVAAARERAQRREAEREAERQERRLADARTILGQEGGAHG